MSIHRNQSERFVVVARAATVADANLIKATLAAHGFDAALQPFSAYPSVDFVEGRSILVRIEQEAAARDVLRRAGIASDPPR